jgi:polyhydroxybutyrate depolymerase
MGEGMKRKKVQFTATISALVLSVLVAACMYPSADAIAANAPALERHLRIDGLDRRYIAYLPDNYRDKGPLPVVLAFHPGLSDPGEFSLVTGLHQARGAENFIIAYPEGFRRTWNSGGGCCGAAVQQNIDDLKFVRTILDDLGSIARIDRRRIYATGYSNGGSMTFHLACEMADVFAAVATVSSSMRQDPRDCRPSRPVPLFELHGLQDSIVPYNGGVTGAPRRGAPVAPPVRPTRQAIDFWKQVNGTSKAERVSMFGGRADCEMYSGEREGSMVQHCRLPGMGHRWPGGRQTAQAARSDAFVARFVGDLGPHEPTVDASGAILSFFSRYTR